MEYNVQKYSKKRYTKCLSLSGKDMRGYAVWLDDCML